MNIRLKKKLFEISNKANESALITFKGVEGWDVYNCSMLFMWKGKRHMYGRVEKREEWANSHVRLFVETGKDEFTVLPGHSWELEDPYVQKVNGELIFGGTHIEKKDNSVISYSSHFFRGPSPTQLRYFASGPLNMKDVRVVQLSNDKIGVFSRPKDAYKACIGFVVIDNIEELNEGVIIRTTPIDILEPNSWGGVNQAYLLASGQLGCIAHYSYIDTDKKGKFLSVYVNYAFVFNPQTYETWGGKIIGTRRCYPRCAAKKKRLTDCVFSSGIVMRLDGRCDLYSGIGDTHQGRLTIDYPFSPYGTIIDNLCYGSTPSSL